MQTSWMVAVLVAFGVAVAVGPRLLIARLRRTPPFAPRPLGALLADAMWAALVVAGGLVMAQYAARVPYEALVVGLCGLLAVLLSFLRAWLYQRVQERPPSGVPANPFRRADVLRTLIYPLAALVVYLIISGLARDPADPWLFIPLFIGSLLPDLDSSHSAIGRLLPFLSRRIEARFGPQGAWHTPAAGLLVAAICAVLIPVIGWPAWGSIMLGFAVHLLVDLFRAPGIPLLWPVRRQQTVLLGGPLGNGGSLAEPRLILGLTALSALLLVVVDLGPPPSPPVITPTYEEELARYYALRGRTLVFADVEGTWQATNRRVADRYEILSSDGQSYVMLDRYTWQVFSAGRSSEDNLYLNRIHVLAGMAAVIKPVEFHLQGQRLADLLPTLTAMQQEPGLQHIFLSGSVTVPETDAGAGLVPDQAMTYLPRIAQQDARHFTFQYLAASDVMPLANLEVESGDLMVVATYANPPTGPTATPLPSPPPSLVAPTLTPESS